MELTCGCAIEAFRGCGCKLNDMFTSFEMILGKCIFFRPSISNQTYAKRSRIHPSQLRRKLRFPALQLTISSKAYVKYHFATNVNIKDSKDVSFLNQV